MPVDGLRTRFDDLAALGPPDDLIIEGVEVLHVFFEAPSDPVRAVLPPVLHPTIPGSMYATFLRAGDSPWGAFTLAEVRISARLRERPRQLLVGAVCDNLDAAAALSRAWGFRFVDGEVRLRRSYDRVEGQVTSGGEPVLEAWLMDPEPIPGATLQYGPWANPALVDGEAKLVLVDPVVVFGEDRQRGGARMPAFDGTWWSAPGVRPTVPIGSYYAVVGLRLPPPSELRSLGSG